MFSEIQLRLPVVFRTLLESTVRVQLIYTAQARIGKPIYREIPNIFDEVVIRKNTLGSGGFGGPGGTGSGRERKRGGDSGGGETTK